MRNSILLLAMLAAPASAAERNYSVTSFDRVRVDGPFRVKLVTGVAPYAKATGSPQALDRVTIEVQGRTLIVHASRSSWGGYPGEAPGPVEISLGTHELSNAWVNGSGSLSIDKVKGLHFSLAMQGAGNAAIAAASVDRLDVGISGAGSAKIGGTAAKLNGVVRGTSSLDASALKAKDAVLGADGPSSLKANVSGSVEIQASGTSEVAISGAAACTVKASGSAVVSGCR